MPVLFVMDGDKTPLLQAYEDDDDYSDDSNLSDGAGRCDDGPLHEEPWAEVSAPSGQV